MNNIYNYLAEVFKPILDIPYGDKLIHFVFFGLIGLVALSLPRESAVSIAMFSAFAGIIWEMIWHFVGRSVFDWKDVLADFAGGLVTGSIAYLYIDKLRFYIPL